jgi:class 3 adenylate cyclase/tetratricopeptide (TPR) repeat protein
MEDSMNTQEVKRKLTVILSADVKGYSRLMGEDEEWTVHTLNTYKGMMRGIIQQHRGRIVDALGDNVLAEFASVVDAVQCAVEIQQVLRAKNAMLPESRRMEFRIGINLGDVIEEGNAIYGDGVNIAARLEGLAEAGGICISGSAFEQIENKLPLRYKYLGEHQVKNIVKPVRVYRAQIEPEATTPKKAKPTQWQRAALGFVVAAIVAVAAIMIWKFYISPAPQPEVASKEKITTALAEKPLATMPPSTEVVPKEKKTPPSPEKVSKPAVPPAPKAEVTDEKSMDSIRKTQEQSKDWEEMKKKTEEALKEIEKLKKQIGKGEGDKVSQEKYAKAVNELNAVDWLKKGYVLRYRDKKNQEAMKAFDKAIEIDPNFAKPYAGRAAIYNDWEQHQHALRESEQAIKLDPNLAWGFNARGWAHIGLLNYQKAIEDLNKAIELDPYYIYAYCHRSWAYLMLKNYHQALEDANKAIELDPKFSYANFRRGMALASLNKFQDAIKDFDKAIKLDPTYSRSFLHRGYTFLKLDKTEQALEDLKKAANLGNNDAQSYLKKKGIQW